MEAVIEKRKTELLDALAELEHKQWKDWALAILDSEYISKSRSERWLNLIDRGWSELSPDEKFKDYEYAEKVLWLLKKHLGIR